MAISCQMTSQSNTITLEANNPLLVKLAIRWCQRSAAKKISMKLKLLPTASFVHLALFFNLAIVTTALLLVPAAANGQVVWFKANAITGVAGGGKLATWLDSSGNGFNATQTLSQQQPTYVTNALNGLPVVHFNSANNNYLRLNSVVSNDFTMIFVFRSTQGIGTSTAFYDGAGLINGEMPGVQNDFGTCLNANGQIISGTGNPDVSINSGSGCNDGRPHVVTFKRTMSTGVIGLYVDTILVATATGGKQSLTAPPQLVMGAQQTLINFLNGDIAELLIYNSALSDTSRQAVENTLITKYAVSLPTAWPQVMIPTFNTNEIVVAAATPQEYGAKGDGITDDSAAFQNAMNAVYNSGGAGGGVVFVQTGNYAFYTNLTIPTGVTLHGDWQDWTRGSNGLVGTTFKVYYGAGQSNTVPFIFLNGSTALRDVNIWYPNQQAANISSYPFSIGLYGDCVVQNVVLVNSYQGIQVTAATSGAKHILSTIIGTPLSMGIDLDMIADISHAEDIRFSPDVWPASQVTNAPAAGDSYAAWMRANGEGMRLRRVDGEACLGINISGYNVGIEANSGTNGSPGASFYSGSVSNCGTALLAQEMPFQSGLQFARFNLDGDIAVAHTSNDIATLQFYNCQLTGRNGTAVNLGGPAGNWISWAQFQDCTISGTLQLGSGVFNVVNSSLNVPPSSNHCVLGANATRAAFVGCNFSPVRSIINTGNSNRVIIDGRRALSNTIPQVEWISVVNNYLSRKPAKNDLYVVTTAAWGATGNGVTDDTTAIQLALTAAGTNGGGIVYLPAGKYRLTNTLDVPSGVELRGSYEMRHRTWPGPDGHAKGTVLQPYGGQATTNGPVAIALENNSGLVGVTISYETQNSNAIAFPPTIQGRGGNVYVIGTVCPNPYYYVDLDTYTCTNHFIYMVDGWALRKGYSVGNGSSGSIIDCQGNWTYWWDNYDSQSVLGSSSRDAMLNYSEHNLEMYVLGDCTELLVKNFVIPSHTFLHCISENGRGPNITGIATMCDQTTEGFRLDAGAACNLNTINSSMALFADYPDLVTNTVGVISTSSFQGTARFFNSAVFGGPYWDFVIGGGDISFAQVHMLDHSFQGSRVDGGVFHLINNGAYISYNGASNFPPYNVTFGAGAGINGKVSEMIGCYSYNGCNYSNSNPINPVLAWANYNLATPLTPVNTFEVTPPPLLISSTGITQCSILNWPGNAGAFNLYSTRSIASPVTWTLATNTPLFANSQWTVTLTNSANIGFYRLQQ